MEKAMKITLESLSVKRGGKLVLNNLNAVFEGPGLYQVIGPNGSGKTTLLLTIMGVLKPTSGRVLIEGFQEVTKPFLSYMPQYYSIPRDAPITVYEFIEGYYKMTKPWPRFKVVGSRVEEALKRVGVPKSLWSEKLSKLSGGMIQRVFLARALVLDPPILLLDEPFSNIDPEGKVDLADSIGELSRDKLVIVTSHDPILLLEYTRRILVIGHGYYVFGEVNEVLKQEVLKKFYKRCAIELEKHVHIVDWH
jgi:zinc/manganese transport system ATP-binding protein